MAQPSTVKDAIDLNARGPKRVQVANQSVEQHSIDDQIKAANFAAGVNAAKKPHFGLRMTQLVPPGAG